MDRQSTRTALALRLGAAALLVGLFASVLWAAFRPMNRPLHLAINPWPGYEFAPLAEAMGFFADEGVEVHLVEMASLSDSRRAFELGQVDGFFGTPVEWLVAEQHSDRRGTAVLVTDASEGADVILARAPIGSVADLRGKRVGLERGSLHVLILAEALGALGLDLGDVEIVHIPALDATRAFRAGEVDAVVSYPPFSLEVLAGGDAETIFSTSEIPGRVIDLLVFESAIVEARREDIARIRSAYFRAQRFAADHPDRALPIMAARHRLSVEEFTDALEGIRLLGEAEQDAYLGTPWGGKGLRGGTLERIMTATRAALVETGELSGPALVGADSGDSRKGRPAP